MVTAITISFQPQRRRLLRAWLFSIAALKNFLWRAWSHLQELYAGENRWTQPLFKYGRIWFFWKKHVISKRLVTRKKFDLAFFDMCNPRYMFSVNEHNRKIVCRRLGSAQATFYFLSPDKVRLFFEFLIYTSLIHNTRP